MRDEHNSGHFSGALEGAELDAAAARPIETCTKEALGDGHHALVYGRARIWYKNLSDDREFLFHWSKYAWWKAMWYPHRGGPDRSHTWGVYAGSDGHTGPGDAELSHWLPVPPEPRDQTTTEPE